MFILVAEVKDSRLFKHKQGIFQLPILFHVSCLSQARDQTLGDSIQPTIQREREQFIIYDFSSKALFPGLHPFIHLTQKLNKAVQTSDCVLNTTNYSAFTH